MCCDAAGRLYTAHADRSLRAYESKVDGRDSEIFKIKPCDTSVFTSLSVVAASKGHLLVSTDEVGEAILWDLGDGGEQVPAPIWRCAHAKDRVARDAYWLPADRNSALSGAEGTLVVGYDPLEFQMWRFPGDGAGGGDRCWGEPAGDRAADHQG